MSPTRTEGLSIVVSVNFLNTCPNDMPTEKQKKAAEKIVENHGNISKTMKDVGYSENTAKNPKNLTDSDGWKELMETVLSDEKLLDKHNELLNSTGIDHLVFPLGPKDEDDINFSGGKAKSEPEVPEEYKERTTLTDKEIIEMLTEVNCKVRRIVHGQVARHVYFWSADNKARKDALDMAYKIKGRYKDKSEVEHKFDFSDLIRGKNNV